MDIKEKIQHIIQNVKSLHAPDKREAVFDIRAKRRKETILLEGEISDNKTYDYLLKEISLVTTSIKNNIRLLPDATIGEKQWGIIYNSVAKLQTQSSFASEVVSELLLGMPVKILDRKKNWFRVQTAEGYIGWISEAITSVSESELREYNRKPKVIVVSWSACAKWQPNPASENISDLVAGNLLTYCGKEGDYYQVTYPDGRVAYIHKSDVQNFNDWKKSITLSGESIVETAEKLKGLPYFWGGTSSKGLDCSGYTKLIYLLHGLILPRDASQQIKTGRLVDEIKNFDNVQKGDLLFFGTKATAENPTERVVHVGIYIGNKQFLHASDYVKIGSFDPNDRYFDAFNAQRYLRTKRYIADGKAIGIHDLNHHPFYQ